MVLVASLFKGLEGFEVVHRDEWMPIRWDAVINTAALSSKTLCDIAHGSEVLKANVLLPLQIREAIDKSDREVKFIQMSSCAVYKHPEDPDDVLDEDSPLYPLHSYNASKILMEKMLAGTDTHIFRIGRVVTDNGHHSDFNHHISNWTHAEDRRTSITSGESIVKAVDSVLTKQITPGVYNIVSEVIHLPSYIKSRYGWEGEIVPADSMVGLGPWPILNGGKAKRHGLL